MLDEGLGVLVEGGGEGDLAPEDVLVDAHGILIVEGVDACVHFVDEHAEGPPVDGLAVALIEDDFGGDVLGRAADGEGPALGEELGKAEVSEFEVAVVGDEEVLGLKVAENDVFGVEVLEAGGDGGGVEAGLVGGEGLHVT